MNRDQILDTAGSLINGDRARDYGDAAENFQRIADLWCPILGVDVTATDVALCLTQLKVARLITSPGHQDSWVDAAGYVALGGEIAGRSALDAALCQEPLADREREQTVNEHESTKWGVDPGPRSDTFESMAAEAHAAFKDLDAGQPYVVHRVPRVGRSDYPAFDADTIYPLRTEPNTVVTEAVYADPQGETVVRGTE